MLPAWRRDLVGTRPLQIYFQMVGFTKREYGIMGVMGMNFQSWETLTASTCKWREWAGGISIAQAGAAMYTSGAEEAAKHLATSGFSMHMTERCACYSAMQMVSRTTLVMTWVCMIVSFTGVTLSCFTALENFGWISIVMLN